MIAALRTQLANGDQVEIVTSRAQTPSPTWERFVVTGKAKAAIRRFVRTRQRDTPGLATRYCRAIFTQHGIKLLWLVLRPVFQGGVFKYLP